MHHSDVLTKKYINDTFERFGLEGSITVENGRTFIETDKLKPHPQNELIYGQDDISDMVTKIVAADKILVPLVITDNFVIISGHRRWKAAVKLGYDEVPCEFVTFESEADELAALVLYNCDRNKTTSQRAREGMSLEHNLAMDAFIKRLSSLKQNQPDMDESSTTEKPSKKEPKSNEDKKSQLTRGKVAEAVGIKSGKSYSRAKTVLIHVDGLKKEGNAKDAELFITVLNRSASAAEDLLKVDLSTLSDDDRKKLALGQLSPSSFLTVGDSDTSEKKYATAKKQVKRMGNAVNALKDTGLSIGNDKQAQELRKEIESMIASLNSLLA